MADQRTPCAWRRILVTGSGGVTGAAMRAITADDPSGFIFATSRDCDLTNPQAAMSFIAGCGADAVIHLAAVSGGIGKSLRHPASMLRDNAMMAINVLEGARRAGVGKVIMTLSSGMYPPEAPLPLREDSIHDGAAHFSNYGYAFAKRLMEPMIRAWREEYGLSVIGLIPNGIYGEHDNFNADDAPMLPSLIRRFHQCHHGDEPIVIWGDGSPLREYTYAPDLARAFLWALNHYDAPQVLNVGSCEEHSIRAIAEMIADVYGIDRCRLTFDTGKPNGVFRKGTDNSRFLALSRFTYTPLQEGLERTITWYRQTAERFPERLRLDGKTGAVTA